LQTPELSAVDHFTHLSVLSFRAVDVPKGIACFDFKVWLRQCPRWRV